VIEVFVESIRVNMTNYKRVVMLKEKTAQRYLPIWIGHFEADAIAIPMQNVPVSRPLTHDLLGSVIASLGGKVTQVTSRSTHDQAMRSPWRSGRRCRSSSRTPSWTRPGWSSRARPTQRNRPRRHARRPPK
jgi:hypothetical protein